MAPFDGARIKVEVCYVVVRRGVSKKYAREVIAVELAAAIAAMFHTHT